jgi:hypothetical protein
MKVLLLVSDSQFQKENKMSVITDYNGNVVCWSGTDEEALNKGYNIDCSDCSRCSRCVYCSLCSDCSGCSYCSDCSECSYCLHCSDCSRCSDCSNCLAQPKANIITNTWTIVVRNDNSIRVGCQDYTLKEWLSYDETHLLTMDANAVEFMNKWKNTILEIVKN